MCDDNNNYILVPHLCSYFSWIIICLIRNILSSREENSSLKMSDQMASNNNRRFIRFFCLKSFLFRRKWIMYISLYYCLFHTPLPHLPVLFLRTLSEFSRHWIVALFLQIGIRVRYLLETILCMVPLFSSSLTAYKSPYRPKNCPEYDYLTHMGFKWIIIISAFSRVYWVLCHLDIHRVLSLLLVS